MFNYEKLGLFYLGRQVSPDRLEREDELLLYEANDLTTHAVCVGMTGSGKTGLCIGLMEEAAIDAIPAIIIDPKGDMGNLCLMFPDMSAQAFEPWVDPEEASRRGLSTMDFAEQEAKKWRNGLADWQQDAERIRHLQQTTDVVLYTPGGTAGRPLSILQVFGCPGPEILSDSEQLGERINSTVSGLLGLLGLSADPLQSRDHIFLATILQHYWKQGQDVDLASLINAIQNPPFQQVGVMSLDTFYPKNERQQLAVRCNNLLASPSFASWMEGEPLDIDRLLYNAQGKPQLAILSIAHLGDAERMFFVTLLLNQMVAWMRRQPGTTSLRAILYMDEIFGYFPPVANPPSKAPLLTLLKQARAYGLGIMLTTQNPVDLDYKALSNMGTWFIGRLQTDRDRQRLLDGLENASSLDDAFDRAALDQRIAGLKQRVFLMRNVHETEPVLFEARWALSYLRGPLTRREIEALQITQTEPERFDTDPLLDEGRAPLVGSAVTTPSPEPAGTSGVDERSAGVTLPAGIEAYYAPPREARVGDVQYRAAVAGFANVHFENTKHAVNETTAVSLAALITEDIIPVQWEEGFSLPFDASLLERTPRSDIRPGTIPTVAAPASVYKTWEKACLDTMYRTNRLHLFHSPDLKITSNVGETERDFRIRLRQKRRELRDEAIDKLKARYATKIRSLNDKVRRAEQAVKREQEQAQDAKLQTTISLGSTLLTAFLGRKKLSQSTLGRATTTARGASRAARQAGDVERSQATLEAHRDELTQLETELQAEIDQLTLQADLVEESLSTIEIKPLKRDVQMRLFGLIWLPYQGDEPAWQSTT